MDFMSNTLFGGKRYRILNIMDEFNREFIEFEGGVIFILLSLNLFSLGLLLRILEWKD